MYFFDMCIYIIFSKIYVTCTSIIHNISQWLYTKSTRVHVPRPKYKYITKLRHWRVIMWYGAYCALATATVTVTVNDSARSSKKQHDSKGGARGTLAREAAWRRRRFSRLLVILRSGMHAARGIISEDYNNNGIRRPRAAANSGRRLTGYIRLRY